MDTIKIKKQNSVRVLAIIIYRQTNKQTIEKLACRLCSNDCWLKSNTFKDDSLTVAHPVILALTKELILG